MTQLKEQEPGDVGVICSVRLVRSLARHNRLRLVDSITTKTGLVIATYEPAECAASASPSEVNALALPEPDPRNALKQHLLTILQPGGDPSPPEVLNPAAMGR